MGLVDVSQINGISDLQNQIDDMRLANELVSGGVEWSGTDLIYDVTTLVYRLQNVMYTSSPTQVTLAASDPTDDRIDVVYVDTAGVVAVVTGTPAPEPVKPLIPDTADQIAVTFITIGAGTTEPAGITYEDIYLENAGTGGGEWDAIGDAATATNSVADPYEGSIHITHSLTKELAGTHVSFAHGSTYNVPSAGTLSFRIKLSYPMTRSHTKLNIGFTDSGNLVGTAPYIGGGFLVRYGLDPSNVTDYQLVSIPLAQFSLPSTVDGLKFFTTRSGLGAFLLDKVRVIEGDEPEPQPDLYVKIAGDTMSGVLDWDDAYGDVTIQIPSQSYIALDGDAQLSGLWHKSSNNETVLWNDSAGGALSLDVASDGTVITEFGGIDKVTITSSKMTLESGVKLDYSAEMNITDIRGNVISSTPSPTPVIFGLNTISGQAMYLVDGAKATLEYDANNKFEADPDGVRLYSGTNNFKFYNGVTAFHVNLDPTSQHLMH
jgi:hypothetical protein